MRSVARLLAQRGVHTSTAASDVLSWLGAAAVGGAAVAAVGQPLATPATEHPPSAVPVDGGGSAGDVWRYDEEGRVVAESDAPADAIVETEQLPVWYKEAAQEIAALGDPGSAARPPGSHPWGHLYQVQPARGARNAPAASRVEIADVAAVNAPDPIAAARVDIGDAATGTEDTNVRAGQSDATIDAAGVDIGDAAAEREVAGAVAGRADASTDATVDIGDSAAAADTPAETPQIELTAAELPLAATSQSVSVEDSYVMWLRGGSVPTAPGETAACWAQDPLGTGTVQQRAVTEPATEPETKHVSDEWVEVRADDGRVYYWCTRTDETAWDPPSVTSAALLDTPAEAIDDTASSIPVAYQMVELEGGVSSGAFDASAVPSPGDRVSGVDIGSPESASEMASSRKRNGNPFARPSSFCSPASTSQQYSVRLNRVQQSTLIPLGHRSGIGHREADEEHSRLTNPFSAAGETSCGTPGASLSCSLTVTADGDQSMAAAEVASECDDDLDDDDDDDEEAHGQEQQEEQERGSETMCHTMCQPRVFGSVVRGAASTERQHPRADVDLESDCELPRDLESASCAARMDFEAGEAMSCGHNRELLRREKMLGDLQREIAALRMELGVSRS